MQAAVMTPTILRCRLS